MDGMSSVKPATNVTVITDGNVFVTEGLGAGTIMKYADWLILAYSEPIVVSVPIPTSAMKNSLSDIGTKFKWILNEETYRVAIQTADGVLQVKSVTDGGGDVHNDACDCNRCLYNTSGRLPLTTPMQEGTLKQRNDKITDKQCKHCRVPFVNGNGQNCGCGARAFSRCLSPKSV